MKVMLTLFDLYQKFIVWGILPKTTLTRLIIVPVEMLFLIVNYHLGEALQKLCISEFQSTPREQ